MKKPDLVMNGVHHVIKFEPENDQYETWCGEFAWSYDQPISIHHARACIEKETYVQPCKKCMAAYNKDILPERM